MELMIKYTFIEEIDENIRSYEERNDIVEVPDDVKLDVWMTEKYPPWVPGGDEQHDFTYGCRNPVVKSMDGRVILYRRDKRISWGD